MFRPGLLIRKRTSTYWSGVQRSATILLSGFANCSYEERLKQLGITTLRKRRERGDLIGLEVYRITSGEQRIEKTRFFRPARSDYGLRRPNLEIGKERWRLDVRKFSFSETPVVNSCYGIVCCGKLWMQSPSTSLQIYSIDIVGYEQTMTILDSTA